MNKSFFGQIRPLVFFPPFLIFLLGLGYGLVDQAGFLNLAKRLNGYLIAYCGDGFVWTAFLALPVCLLVLVSPLGRVRIGGERATPLFGYWKWFSITLCTTIATGILFWGAAEPVSHLYHPPASLGIKAGSPEAGRFALQALFLHWTFIPYAIYTLPGILFAFAYFNMGRAFSLASIFAPLKVLFFPDRPDTAGAEKSIPAQLVDAACLYALVGGMSASLGTGILTLSGGLRHLTGLPDSLFIKASFALGIVFAFTLSSISGLMKGIRILSDLNVKVFFLLIGFIFLIGPSFYILSAGMENFFRFLGNFPAQALLLDFNSDDVWPGQWTVFNWANWMSWAPVTAMFLARISKGRTFREFVVINLILPALFGVVWMAVLGGTAIHADLYENAGLGEIMTEQGPESLMYAIMKDFPFSALLIAFFLFIVFLSYVTAADSNTTAMSALSAGDISPESPEPPVFVKLLWGVIVGGFALIMVTFAGVDGVKMASNLGGLPALILEILALPVLLLIAFMPGRFAKK